jgi:hypothetical protein
MDSKNCATQSKLSSTHLLCRRMFIQYRILLKVALYTSSLSNDLVAPSSRALTQVVDSVPVPVSSSLWHHCGTKQPCTDTSCQPCILIALAPLWHLWSLTPGTLQVFRWMREKCDSRRGSNKQLAVHHTGQRARRLVVKA